MKLRGADPQLLDLMYGEEDWLTPEQLRQVLTSLVERIELDPKSRRFEIYNRLPVT